MTFVILQSCCNEASCVDVCPVDCIHPKPGEPAFMRSEMLYIDPTYFELHPTPAFYAEDRASIDSLLSD